MNAQRSVARKHGIANKPSTLFGHVGKVLPAKTCVCGSAIGPCSGWAWHHDGEDCRATRQPTHEGPIDIMIGKRDGFWCVVLGGHYIPTIYRDCRDPYRVAQYIKLGAAGPINVIVVDL